jgi:membrane-associated protein
MVASGIAMMAQTTRTRWLRLAVLGLALWVLCAGMTVLAVAQEPGVVEAAPAAAEEGFWDFVTEILSNIFNSSALMRTLSKPHFVVAAFVAMNVIVFVETGLLFPFLPGDSLLVTAGLIAANPASGWNVWLLIFTLCFSAIVGDSVAYSIGFKSGPKLFNRENSLFFHKDHLLKAQQFYEKHGGKTIILARFMPIIRTFAPVVAGAGRMNYPRFLLFNIFGGLGWVVSMILTGYYLPSLLNKPLEAVFGEGFKVEDHVEKIVIIVVLLSISPGIYVWLRSKFAGKKPQPATPEPQLAEVNK